jgi:hypothetical protein
MAPFMDALAGEVLLKEDGPPALGLVYHLAGAAICCGRRMQSLLQLYGGLCRRVVNSAYVRPSSGCCTVQRHM